ncbi:unnamed protein product [Mucor circinelloides]
MYTLGWDKSYLKPNVSSRPFAAQLLDHNDLLGPNCKSKHYREDCLTAHPVPPHLDAIDIAAWTFFWALSLTMIQRNVIYRFINTCIPHQALLHRLFPQIHLSPMCVVCSAYVDSCDHFLFSCAPKALV